MVYLGGKGGYFQKLSYGSEASDMTSEGLGEMFEAEVSEPKNVASAIQRANPILLGERDPNSSEQRTKIEIFSKFSRLPLN